MTDLREQLLAERDALRVELREMTKDRDWFHDLYVEAVDTYERRLAGTYQPRDENAL